MSAHLALVRGINVGAAKRLPMAKLVELFEAAGAEAVETYIQSGNVVFEARAAEASRIAERIEKAIVAQCGFTAPLVLRSSLEWEKILVGNPYLAEGEENLHVVVWKTPVAADRLARLDPARSPPDEFRSGNGCLYLRLPNGVARTKISNAWLDSALGATTTLRNWATAKRLGEKLAAR